MATLIIDNVGFDIEAMKKLTEKQFIEIHLSNDAIAPWKSEAGRRQYLKDAYSAINPKPVSKYPREEKDEDDND